MESLNDILNNLSEFKKNQHVIINEENNLQISDINDHFDRAKNLIGYNFVYKQLFFLPLQVIIKFYQSYNCLNFRYE